MLDSISQWYLSDQQSNQAEAHNHLSLPPLHLHSVNNKLPISQLTYTDITLLSCQTEVTL